MPGNSYLLEIKPNIPPQLSMLSSFSKDLIYSWHEPIRNLFISLDKELWEDCGHNPSIVLRRIDQLRLEEAAVNPEYLQAYQQAVDWYHQYHNHDQTQNIDQLLDPKEDLVAYFCSEFGFHESFPIYSGGLGILAGDHCKAASDMGVPFVAVGLLYHQGYFTQTIDPDGHQISNNINHYFGHLPITLIRQKDGSELHTEVQLPGRVLTLRLWQAKVGRVRLLLLDCDIDTNSTEDRKITSQLYGEGHDTRIKQEIVLGIGGVKALRKIGLTPNIWHINEGHAAFQILERCHEWVIKGVNFDVALELVAGCTVFTTHTPVAAGHDSFSQETIVDYFSELARELAIDFDKLLALGYSNHDGLHFNMTALALRGSRFHNGVSEIHGGIAASMESYIWPEVPPGENPVTFITNGVHIPGILAKKWASIFSTYFEDWPSHLRDNAYWDCIDSIPDKNYWNTHQALKRKLLAVICHRLHLQHIRNDCSRAFQQASICQIQDPASDILILGFARRFATYKRATLIFSDIDRLSKILNDPDRPVVILFAGKAHPSDQPGQQLIKEIHQFSERPEFVGKIILLEGYDLNLARHMISGSDIWLNMPIYPLEACGTSGQKAAINGVVNLSVMDGWWAEGYTGKNGWAIEPHTDKFGSDYRNQQEASDLLDTIENEVIPAYFDRDKAGIPTQWLQMSKASMKSTIPRFCAQRMLTDYVEKLYLPAKQQNQRLADKDQAGAKSLTEWKKHIRICWPGVNFRIVSKSAVGIRYGDHWSIKLAIRLNGLSPDDIIAECLKGHEDKNGTFKLDTVYQFSAENVLPDNEEEMSYNLDIQPENSGIYHYKLRIYPYNKLLSHTFEMGYMQWL